MDEKSILELYFERNEKAIEETKNKYGAYCLYISRNILGNNEEAAQVENDTYLKIWDTIPPNKPPSLKLYAGTICRNLSINEYNKHNSRKRKCEMPLILDELEECLPDNKSDFAENFELKSALNTFIRSLESQKQEIFIRRYFYSSSIAQIACDFSMKESNVKMILHRLRKELKKHLLEEGIYI